MNDQKRSFNTRPDVDKFRHARLLNLFWAVPVACAVAQFFLYVGLLGYCQDGQYRCNTQDPLLFAQNVLMLLVPLVIGSILSGAVIAHSPWSKRWALRRRAGVGSGILVLMICLVITIVRQAG